MTEISCRTEMVAVVDGSVRVHCCNSPMVPTTRRRYCARSLAFLGKYGRRGARTGWLVRISSSISAVVAPSDTRWRSWDTACMTSANWRGSNMRAPASEYSPSGIAPGPPHFGHGPTTHRLTMAVPAPANRFGISQTCPQRGFSQIAGMSMSCLWDFPNYHYYGEDHVTTFVPAPPAILAVQRGQDSSKCLILLPSRDASSHS